MRHIVNALFVWDGKELLARRSPRRAAYAGLWSFPGGHQEPRETLHEALVREVEEEVGVKPASFAVVGSINDPNAADGDPAIYHLFAVTTWNGGEPALIGDEHTELRWFTWQEASGLTDIALEEYRPLSRVALRCNREADREQPAHAHGC